MPNITTRLGQYCIFHGYSHEDEYLECDFCSEDKSFINLKYRYYNYGFSRRSYLACDHCHFNLFGPFKLGQVDVMERAYESLLEVINDKTDKKNQGNDTTLDYYEAVRIAYNDRESMQKYIGSTLKDTKEINKGFRRIWQFTYRIVNGEEKERVKVVNKDPDNLLVQWVPGGMTLIEILKTNSLTNATREGNHAYLTLVCEFPSQLRLRINKA